jgi:cytochrome c-type biogenesis protein CcmH
MIATLVVTLLSLAAPAELDPGVSEAVGPPAGPPLSGAALEQRLTALASEIRCPVCQGQAIVDSPAESARHMKEQVRAMLAAGYSDEQILVWLEGRYGEFIRLAPRAEGLNLIVWALPIAVLLGGVALAWVIVARSRKAARAAEAKAGAAALDPWIERVREEAGGRDE